MIDCKECLLSGLSYIKIYPGFDYQTFVICGCAFALQGAANLADVPLRQEVLIHVIANLGRVALLTVGDGRGRRCVTQ